MKKPFALNTIVNPMSPLTAMLCSLTTFFWAFTVLQPSLKEFGLIILVDALMMHVMSKIDKRVFPAKHPEFKLIYPDTNHEKIKKLADEEKAGFLNALIKFPQIRAKHFALMSMIKNIPACLVAVFVWEYERSYLSQFVLFLLLDLIIIIYTYSAVLFENYILSANFIEEFHKLYDWSDAFQHAQFDEKKQNFGSPKNVSLFAAITIVTICQITLITVKTPDHISLPLLILTANVIAAVLFAHIWYLNNRYFEGALHRVVKEFETFDYGQKGKILPIHPTKLLANFEQTYNILNDRLKHSERELAQWLIHETEQSRYRALGEISGLVAHDLMGPLHVVQFCVTEMLQKQDAYQSLRYREQLTVNATRAIELVKSLHAYLKNQGSGPTSTKYMEAHTHVIKLLDTQFKCDLNTRLSVTVNAEAQELTLALNQVDIVHILYNLYRNAIDNMISHSVKAPTLEITCKSSNEQMADIQIRDNGTGLSPERFERITAFRFLPSNQNFREGLGLRLVRRLIERNGGSLSVVAGQTPGTTMLLRLPIRTAIAHMDNLDVNKS